MNLGTLDFYDSGQVLQNLMVQNPGFEGQIWNSTIRCMSGTATTCVDDDQWSAWPAGFWNGATFQVFYGAAAGRTGTVSTSTAAGNGQGVTLNFSSSGTAPATGDYLIIRKTVPGGSTEGWWPSTTGAGTISDNFTDLPPGTLGQQTPLLSAPGASDSAQISGFFDSVAGKTFLQLNGTYQVQFKAKGLGGSNQVNILVGRGGVANYYNAPVTLSNTWNTYTLTFTAAENGSAIGIAGLTFSTVGADSFELDDVSLTQLNGDPSNNTIFRDPVVKALRLLQPGILRYWSGQLGDTLDNLLTPAFGRQRAGYSAWSTEQDSIDFGLHDFLVLCQNIGAEPWVVVPTSFSNTDASNLIQYLAGDSGTPYGAKRAALGQSTPWTSVFTKIHLEYANEAWNSAFKGGDIEYPEPYGGQAQSIFGVMRANPAYVASSFDLVLGGQAAYTGRNSDIQNNCNNNDTFAIAPYTMNTVDSFSDNESLYGSTFAEPEAFMSGVGNAEGEAPGMVYQDYQAIQSSSHPVPLSFYEINLSTTGGSITQDALNSYTPSLGAGLMVADTMLLGLREFGITNQNLFALPQYDFQRSDGETALLWGSVVDMGVTDRKRPQFLAVQLANQALTNGAAMLQTVHSGADPTWNQPMVNTVQLNGAHYLQSFAFSQGSNLSAVIFNLSRSSALPVTFSGSNAPNGTVQMQQLTSANPSDTNESANVVAITPSTLNNFNPASGLSLPPYSMTVLTWTAGAGTQTPVISAVTATAITGTSATITWTTDQAASSLVQYGTTSSYGSTSSLNSSLVTTHSVTLTGLTPGTTYNYAAVSANSAGNSATSANFTFSTASQAPVISSVTAAAITGTSATITWTTDQAASSLVQYGTSSSYGSTSALNSSLAITHSVTLTGLTPGTTYNYAAVSANSAGNSATSANFTFSTASQAPVISSVTATAITGTSAAITWTTDQAASSLVQYGTTSSYGSTSAPNSSLAITHSATLTGLTPGTTYNYAVSSANSVGNSATSANFTFTTAAQAPVISAVTATVISSTSATITWTTDQAASSFVQYGTTSSYGFNSSFNTSLVTTHSITLTALTPGTTYNYSVVSINSAGNSATSANFTFATAAQAPVIYSVTAAAISGTSATITWTTDQASSSLVQYGTSNSYGSTSALNSSLVTIHSVTLTGLTPGTTYNYAVSSANSAGNSATSANFTFATAAQAPVISSVTATAISGTSATITWTTDQAASSLVQYGTSSSYGSTSALNSSLVTTHSVTLTGLTPGTTYNYAVSSANSAGNSAISANFTFSTAAQAPVISSVTATAISGTSATITWTTDQAASSLIQYGTSNSYGSTSSLNSSLVTTHSINLTGLTPGTTYNYAVVSANSAGNSATSANFTFATAAQAPVISSVTATAISGTSVTITWTTDQAASSFVQYGTTSSYGFNSSFNASLVTTHSINLTRLTAGTTYNYAVSSANSAGNLATSTNFTFATSAAVVPTIKIIDLAYWGISSSSITISWSTDVPTTTSLAYGTSPALGQLTPLRTNLTNSHGVVLTGLNNGTTYYFVAQATDANGNVGYSNVYQFTTISTAPPTISGIVVTPGANNQAQISWITSDPANSYIEFGSTASYGKWSSATGMTTNPSPWMGWVPSGVVHYHLVSTDSRGNQAVSPDYTFVEP